MLTFAETALIVILGLAVRFAILLVGLALLVTPILLAVMAVEAGVRAWHRSRGEETAGSLSWIRGLFLAPNHLWLKPEGTAIRVGLDDLAQKVLAGLDTIRVARAGTEVHRGDVIAEFRSEGRIARLTSPADGVILDVNTRLGADPNLVHKDPYRRGWLAKLATTTLHFPGTREGETAREWLASEDVQYNAFLEHSLGVAAADGGEFVHPAALLLNDKDWAEAADRFLHIQEPASATTER